jgi:hypothetical protein
MAEQITVEELREITEFRQRAEAAAEALRAAIVE